MKPSEAIEKVKHLKNFLMVYEDIHQVTLMTDSDKEAIDTVVKHCEKQLPCDCVIGFEDDIPITHKLCENCKSKI